MKHTHEDDMSDHENEYGQDGNDRKKDKAKIRGMASVMVLKYHAYAARQALQGVEDHNTEYALHSGGDTKAFDAIAPLEGVAALVGPLFPAVMAMHRDLAAQLVEDEDWVTDEEVIEAYELARKWGVPDGFKHLFR